MLRSISRLLVFLFFAITACAAPSPPIDVVTGGQTSTQPRRSADQTLRIGLGFFPGGITPITFTSYPVFSNQFDTLVRFSPDYKVLPGVAERWELLPDGSAWRFYLRKDLTFSDGEKVTADDVAFSVDLGKRERIPVAQQDPTLTGARRVDDYTVDFLIKERGVATLYVAPAWYIFPKKYFEKVGKDAFMSDPIGSGPYVASNYRASDSVTYRLRPEKHPYRQVVLNEIQVRSIPDPTALIAGVRTGEIDLAFATFSPENVKNAKDSGIAAFEPVRQISYQFYLFTRDLIKGTPMEDKRVRQAMNYAVDKETISKVIFQGLAEPIGQMSVAGQPSYANDVKPVPFDVQRAKRLLADAGYPNGFKIAGGVNYVPSPLTNSIVQAVQGMHRDVGIEYDLIPLENAAFIEMNFGTNGKDKLRRELQFTGGSNQNGIWTFTWGFFKCDNPTGLYCVPETDSNMQRGLAEIDETARNRYLQAAVKAWTEEYPMIFMTTSPQFALATPKVKGFEWTAYAYYTIDGTFKSE